MNPDLPDFQNEPTRPASGKSNGGSLVVMIVCFVVAISAGGVAYFASSLSINNAIENTVSQAEVDEQLALYSAEVNARLDSHDTTIAKSKEHLVSLNTSLATIKQELAQVKSDADKNAKQSHAAVKALEENIELLISHRDTSKTTRGAKAAAGRAGPMFMLTSIRKVHRNFSVTIQDGDQEVLLSLGDTYKGWTLKNAFPSGRFAVFKKGKHTREVDLI